MLRLPSCLCWLLAAIALSPLPAFGTPIQVYILAGQSNMVGSGNTVDLPTSPFDFQAPQTGIIYSYDLDPLPDQIVSNGWEVLRPSVRGDGFGPEITFGREIDLAIGDIAIIKQAANGSSLFEDWDPDATEGRMLHQRMIDQVGSALAMLDTLLVEYELAGVVWMQGEGDAALSVAPTYEQNLTEFIAATRTELGVPDLPFTIGRLSSRTLFSGRDIIRQAQVNVARADPNILAVDLDHLPMQSDRVHYTSDGQIGLGEAFANSILYGAPPEDFQNDGIVSDNDLNIAVAHWNQSVQFGEGDVDGDGFVGMADLQRIVDLIAPPPPLIGTGDLNEDGFVGIGDLNILLPNWNQEVEPNDISSGDTSGDGFIGLADLNQVLAQWNTSPIDTRPPPPTFADLDLVSNGVLDEADVGLLLAIWSYVDESEPYDDPGSDTNPIQADFNADGSIDVEDLRILLDAIALNTPPVVSVPEPSTGMAFLALTSTWAGLRRRRASGSV